MLPRRTSDVSGLLSTFLFPPLFSLSCLCRQAYFLSLKLISSGSISSPSSLSLSFCPPRSHLTVVSVLVDVSQRGDGRAEAAEGVSAGEGDAPGEGERGRLQVQVHPAHLSGFALHLPLHVEGCAHQHVVRPGDRNCDFNSQRMEETGG